MRTATMIAAAVAAGVVGAGAVVTPVVLAADDEPTPTGAGPRWADDGGRGDGPMGGRGEGHGAGMGQGMGPGAGMGQGMGPGAGMGQGMGPGAGQGQGMGPGAGQGMRGEGDCEQMLADVPTGTLTDAQEKTLLAQAEHEKVAHDVYVALGEETGDHRFERIAQSEAQHLEALQLLLDRYDLEDPTEGLAEGEFKSDAAEKSYAGYVADGSKSLDAALAVGQEIEREDIADLEAAVKGLDAPDVEKVYEGQTRASQMHLEAFSR